MNGGQFLAKLLTTYQANYDIEQPFSFHGNTYEAYADFHMMNARYVLVKSAELWRANCFEHVFFIQKEQITEQDIETFKQQLLTYMEPELVRHGNPAPEKDHMYTYLTGIFISDHKISEATRKKLRKVHFRKNYRFAVRGFSEARVLLFDLETQTLVGNPAAKDLKKGYKKLLSFSK